MEEKNSMRVRISYQAISGLNEIELKRIRINYGSDR